MKIKLQITQLAGGREIVLDIERDRSKDVHRWAAEREHRFGMALEAIAASPESAREIAEHALDA